jgi:hypothetical protein
MEIPLIAVRDAELRTGGMSAAYTGTLAGVLDVHTIDPGTRRTGEVRWTTDGRLGTEYDQVAARFDGPTGIPGIGVVIAGEARLDGSHLPSLRSASRARNRLGAFGWRDQNRMSGYLKLAPPDSRLWKLQGFATRKVDRPYDPMWTVDAWIDWCPDDFECRRPSIRRDPAPDHNYYRAADHKTLTDDRRQALVFTLETPPAAWRGHGSLGWLSGRSITSLDGRDDARYVTRSRAPVFGTSDNPDTDPFLIYGGDEPYFARFASDVLSARAGIERWTERGNGVEAGVGATYQTVSGYELDLGFPRGIGTDSLRRYRAWAPGGYGYVQGRWESQGLTLNTGLRVQVFDPGTLDGPTWWPVPSRALWTFSPRLGLAYPMSTRDAFSLSYVRLHQDPGRDFLYDSRLAPINRHPLGNPALEPSEVISYQAALKHVFDDRWSLQLGLFYRDLFGQIGARKNARRQDTRRTYQNADVGHARGFELTAIGRNAGDDRVELHYTYLEAWGTQSREENVPYGPQISRQGQPTGDHPLDWDQRHRIALLGVWHPRPDLELAWSTLTGSGFPWSLRLRRVYEGNPSPLNTRRLGWTENTDVAARLRLPFARALLVGLEVRNLFDQRSELGVTTDGYPHPLINTEYDDYSAYRSETGRAGGAYWDDANGDGLPGWIPVHDPRLGSAPRVVRATVAWSFGVAR